MAGSFRGKHNHRISETGRISIPSKFRDILRTKYESETLVLIAVGDHLRLYPSLEWERQEQKWEEQQAELEDPDFNKFLRHVYALMDDAVLDKNGRIMIGQELRRESGLEGECVVNGFRNHIEIWSADKWAEENSQSEKEQLFSKFANKF